VLIVQGEYDPLELARETEKVVVRGDMRKYYRLSWASKWYGGIVEAYCCGCCWSDFPRDHPEAIGNFYSPEEVYGSLINCAMKKV